MKSIAEPESELKNNDLLLLFIVLTST